MSQIDKLINLTNEHYTSAAAKKRREESKEWKKQLKLKKSQIKRSILLH